MFSSNLNNLATIQHLHRVLPSRSVICFNSANQIPCNAHDRSAVRHCTDRSYGLLLRRSIGFVVTTYNAIDSMTQSILRDLPIPTVNIMRPATTTTTTTAGGNGINVVNATTAIHDTSFRQTLRTVSPALTVATAPYPLLIPLIRGN